jgi:hypothetical protein
MSKTNLDIGIDIDGFLVTFIPRQSEVPFEVSNHIKLSNLQEDHIMLDIYEGVCIQNSLNHCMKTIRLDNVREGMFLIQMKLMEKDGKTIVRVMSDDIILDDIEFANDYKKWEQNDCEEDNELRKWYNARDSFVEFVDNAHQFLNDDDVKPHIRSILQTNEDHMYFQEMMKRLNEAMKVIDLCDDVTKDEYDLMLEEIAEIVNPFISQIQKIVKREKIT